MTTLSPGSGSKFSIRKGADNSGAITQSSENGTKRQRTDTLQPSSEIGHGRSNSHEGENYNTIENHSQFHGQMEDELGINLGSVMETTSSRKNSLTSLDIDENLPDLDMSKLGSLNPYELNQDGLFPPSSSNMSVPKRRRSESGQSASGTFGVEAESRSSSSNAQQGSSSRATLSQSEYRRNNETLTTTNHLLVLSETLEEMARKGEWCDLEISVAKMRSTASSGKTSERSQTQQNSKRVVVKLHSIVAVATSERLRKTLADIKSGKKGPKGSKVNKAIKIEAEKNGTQRKANNYKSMEHDMDLIVLPSSPDKPEVIRLEIQDSSIDADSVIALRTYMYLGILAVSMDSVLGLLDASKYLDVKGSTKLCLEHLKGHIDIKNVLKVLVAANKYSIERLQQTAVEFIDQEFENVVLEPYWLELSEDIVKLLIGRDTLCVRAEASIFMAVSNWAQTDGDSSSSSKGKTKELSARAKCLEKMVSDPSLIRLKNMSREELIQVSQTSLVSKSAELRRVLYDEAMSRVNKPDAEQEPNRLRNYTANHLSNLGFRGNPTLRYPVPELKKCERTLIGHTRAVCALAVCGDDVLSGSGDGSIRVWSSTNNWECYKVLKGHTNSVVALKVYQDKLLSASPDKTICVWEVGTWRHDRVLMGHRSAVCALSICYNDKLCSGSDDGHLKIWNCRTWALERTIQAHSHVIWSLASCREFIVSGSSDTTIRVWDSNNWRFVVTLGQHRDEVQALAVSEDTNELFSGSDDGMICVWNTYTWECIRTLDSNKRAILSLCVYGPNKIILGLGNGVLKVWNSNPLSSDGALTEHSSCVMAVTKFKGKLLSASYDKTVKVWGP